LQINVTYNIDIQIFNDYKSLNIMYMNSKKKLKKKQRNISPKKERKCSKLSCRFRLSKQSKYHLVSGFGLVINRRFPELFDLISKLPEFRKRPVYQVNDLIISGLLMFLFKQQTRNQADSAAKNLDYANSIWRFFKVNIADMDTVDVYLRQLKPQELEDIKHYMITQIIKSKMFQSQRFGNTYYMIAVDGTGLHTFNYEPFKGCPFKQHKNGKRSYTTYVLEAKLVTLSGFSISIATQWIENPVDGKCSKQDIESKAFKRLSVNLKKAFPRLPIMLLLDGLYPNKPVLDICRKNNWRYNIVLKDNSLKTVQQELQDMILSKDYFLYSDVNTISTYNYNTEYRAFKNVKYRDHYFNVLETVVTKTHVKTKEKQINRFVHITDVEVTKTSVSKVSQAGRMRWKIENEGFNNQKNGGYNLQHKFSRTNFNASKNYYQLLQIADIINQLFYKQKAIQDFIKKQGLSIKSVLELILSYLISNILIDKLLISKFQFSTEQLRY